MLQGRTVPPPAPTMTKNLAVVGQAAGINMFLVLLQEKTRTVGTVRGVVSPVRLSVNPRTLRRRPITRPQRSAAQPLPAQWDQLARSLSRKEQERSLIGL